jgi:hypothetical protein
MSRYQLALLLMINIPLYIGIGNFFFKSWREFLEGLSSLYKNRKNVSLFGWDYLSDAWGEVKSFIYIICCILLVYAESHLLTHWPW